MIKKLLMLSILVAISLAYPSAVAGQPLNSSVNITQEQAFNAILHGYSVMDEMQNLNFSVSYINDTLIEARKAFAGENCSALIQNIGSVPYTQRDLAFNILNESQNLYVSKKKVGADYPKVIELIEKINETQTLAYKTSDLLTSMELKARDYKRLGVNVTSAENYLLLAKESFKAERYKEAQDYINKADDELESNRADLLTLNILKNMSKSFLQKHWLSILIAFSLTGSFTIAAWELTLKIRARRKLEFLKIEEKTLKNLIKKTQEDYFQKKSIPALIYKIRMDKYYQKLSKIHSQIPVYERLVSGKNNNKKKKH